MNSFRSFRNLSGKFGSSLPEGNKSVRTFLTVINANEKGVRLSFGRYTGTLSPGIHLKVPFYHEVHKVPTTNRIYNINEQALISRDNVTFNVDSSVQFRVVDPYKTFVNATDYSNMVVNRSQMALRGVLSNLEINEILHNMIDVTKEIEKSLEDLEKDWGVKVTSVQLKDISFDTSMKRAMAVKAEADRNAEAKIINARADMETAKIYAEAAEIYKENPLTIRLREFQLWNSVSKNPSNTIYVVPSDLLGKIGEAIKNSPGKDHPFPDSRNQAVEGFPTGKKSGDSQKEDDKEWFGSTVASSDEDYVIGMGVSKEALTKRNS